MAEYMQLFRTTVAPESVPRLLEIRGAAIAEARRLCPALLRAELVYLGGDAWLDVLVWSRPDGEQLLMQRAGELVAAAEMHALLTDTTPSEMGEIVHASRHDAVQG